MKKPGYVRMENVGGLSLEAMGYLLMLACGVDEESVQSSRVTIESAKDELIAKNRVRFIQQEKTGGCG
jgi:hypothetical protein